MKWRLHWEWARRLQPRKSHQMCQKVQKSILVVWTRWSPLLFFISKWAELLLRLAMVEKACIFFFHWPIMLDPVSAIIFCSIVVYWWIILNCTCCCWVVDILMEQVSSSGSFPGKEEMLISLQKMENDLKEACQERDKALQELTRLKQHLLEKVVYLWLSKSFTRLTPFLCLHCISFSYSVDHMKFFISMDRLDALLESVCFIVCVTGRVNELLFFSLVSNYFCRSTFSYTCVDMVLVELDIGTVRFDLAELIP